MKYNQILNTDFNVSVLGLGTWVFGQDMWGGGCQEDSILAVQAAIDSGINFIDTAPAYGWGLAEQIIGKAIAGKRDKVFLATKCGLVKDGKKISINLSRESIQKEIDASLQRLNTNYIDLYQCHWPDPHVPIEETIGFLGELKKAGKIRHIGVSNFDLSLLKKSVDLTTILSLQSQYSLLARDIEKDVLPFCREKKIGVIAYGPLGGGILTGKYHKETSFKGGDARSFFYKYYKGDQFKRIQEWLDKMKTVDHPLNQIALNWVRQQAGVVCALVGCRRVQQVLDNVAAVSWDLTDQELQLLAQMPTPLK